MNVILHRRDLRTDDNKALEAAGEDGAPIYVFDPDTWDHPLSSNKRQRFVLESLKDLNRQYITLGTKLKFFAGDINSIASTLQSKRHRVLFNKDSNHLHQEKEKKLRKNFDGVEADAVEYRDEGRSDKWDEKAEKWFNSSPHNKPDSIKQNNLEGNTSLQKIRQKYNIQPQENPRNPGGTHEAQERLKKFRQSIGEYSGSISSPYEAEESTSHLSPYIKYGCISLRKVYQEINSLDSNHKGVQMFKDRIFWHQHFNQKIEDNPKLFEQAINPVYRDLHRENRDEKLVEAWKNGRTGYPLIDASMRALVKTGWLNFRMRAMCASFYSYILKQWWKEGADFFYKNLIDADVAINYYQWQMQSGLIGVHANRIYNPTKQAEENDPEGKFIRKYVPELRPLPNKHIHTPWKTPAKTQEKLGVKIGENYPKPIIRYEQESRKAREFFKRKSSEAYSAFKQESVWKKASLSSKHSRQEIIEKGKTRQKGLREFQQ